MFSPFPSVFSKVLMCKVLKVNTVWARNASSEFPLSHRVTRLYNKCLVASLLLAAPAQVCASWPIRADLVLGGGKGGGGGYRPWHYINQWKTCHPGDSSHILALTWLFLFRAYWAEKEVDNAVSSSWRCFFHFALEWKHRWNLLEQPQIEADSWNVSKAPLASNASRRYLDGASPSDSDCDLSTTLTCKGQQFTALCHVLIRLELCLCARGLFSPGSVGALP